MHAFFWKCTPKIWEIHPDFGALHFIGELMQCQYPASIFLMWAMQCWAPPHPLDVIQYRPNACIASVTPFLKGFVEFSFHVFLSHFVC
jgi:hypothetical protein